jgi:hypothetical protein
LPLTRLRRGIESVRAEVLVHAGGVGTFAPAAHAPASLVVLTMSTKLAAAALAVSALAYFAVRILLADEGPARHSELSLALVASASELAPPSAPGAPVAREGRVDANVNVVPLETADIPPPRNGLWLAGELLGLDGLDPTLTEIHVRAQERSLSPRPRRRPALGTTL